MSIFIEPYDFRKTYPGQKRFDCEHDLINKFVRDSLKQQARKDLSKAYALIDNDAGGQFIGFYTIGAFSIEALILDSLGGGSLTKSVSCLRLGMLGVDKAYKKRSLGSKLLVHAIDNMISVSDKIGIYGLYLDADAGAVDFYEKHSFALLTARQDPNPTPMFLHIQTAKNAISI